MTQTTNDNSGMGVILGILVAVLLVVGGFFFLKSQGVIGAGSTTTANIEAPDVTVNTTEPAGGEPSGDAPSSAPAQ